jgi:hypothetical protein
MLLRRISEHVKAQNWTAVTLDFVIVVVGVFIGIQVSNWNAERADRALAQRYVEDIRRDIAADLEVFEAAETSTAQRRDAAEAVLRAIETGAYENAGLFLRQVDMAGRYYPTVLERATYDDLVATGGLRLIDRRIRESITEYYRFAEQQDSGFGLQRDRVFDEYLPLAVAALSLESQRWIYTVLSEDFEPIPDTGPDSAEAERTLAALAHDGKATNALKAVIRGSWSMDRQLSGMRAHAKSILAMLEGA